MTDTELYRQLLGLAAPWQVSHIELNITQQQVRVHVTYDFYQAPLLCPECGQAGPYYDLREERTWRHLDSCQFQTFLGAHLPRIQCPTHGVKTIAAPWCEPHSRFTLAFECFAIAVLSATGVQAKAARLLRLSPTQVQVLPKAQTVHDRFPIAQYLADAVDKTRRDENRADENRALAKAGASPLVKSKWLRSPEKLTDKQRALFTALQSHALETSKVWSFKEAFRDFFCAGSVEAGSVEAGSVEAGSVEEGEAFFGNWSEQALALGNKHLTKVAQRLQDHLPGLLAYLCHRTSNAVAEGLNGQIQLIKARARGFRQFAQFRIAILFFLGKLDMNPHKTR